MLTVTIPWKSAGNVSSPATLVQVSRLELKRARNVPGFLITALRIRRAALNTPGAVGLSLRAAPFQRTFWTLSSWEHQDAIAAFVRSDIHRTTMLKYRNLMAGSHFHTWTCTAPSTRQPDWNDAHQRYDASIGST